jgi:hypothetical protein
MLLAADETRSTPDTRRPYRCGNGLKDVRRSDVVRRRPPAFRGTLYE